MNFQYMVLVEGKGEPRKIHTDYLSAIEEANRLVRLENRKVRVLKIVAELDIIVTVTTTQISEP